MPDKDFTLYQEDIGTFGHTASFRDTPERRMWVRVLEFAMEEMHGDPGKLLKWVDTDDFKIICKAVGCRPAEAAKYIKRKFNGQPER